MLAEAKRLSIRNDEQHVVEGATKPRGRYEAGIRTKYETLLNEKTNADLLLSLATAEIEKTEFETEVRAELTNALSEPTKLAGIVTAALRQISGI